MFKYHCDVTKITMNYMKNSWVECDNISHAFGGRSRQLISMTLKPRKLGSVTTSPRGWYTVSFCSATNFDTFLKHWKYITFISHHSKIVEGYLKVTTPRGFFVLQCFFIQNLFCNCRDVTHHHLVKRINQVLSLLLIPCNNVSSRVNCFFN